MIEARITSVKDIEAYAKSLAEGYKHSRMPLIRECVKILGLESYERGYSMRHGALIEIRQPSTGTPVVWDSLLPLEAGVINILDLMFAYLKNNWRWSTPQIAFERFDKRITLTITHNETRARFESEEYESEAAKLVGLVLVQAYLYEQYSQGREEDERQLYDSYCIF